MTCYRTSCWCAPCRWLACCCHKELPKYSVDLETPRASTKAVSAQAFTTAAVEPAHHRERTWQMLNGRMQYTKYPLAKVSRAASPEQEKKT
jgi:hypothetical protein